MTERNDECFECGHVCGGSTPHNPELRRTGFCSECGHACPRHACGFAACVYNNSEDEIVTLDESDAVELDGEQQELPLDQPSSTALVRIEPMSTALVLVGRRAEKRSVTRHRLSAGLERLLLAAWESHMHAMVAQLMVDIVLPERWPNEACGPGAECGSPGCSHCDGDNVLVD